MHRSEDDYLLTTRLFCGKSGAMMAGEIGTSHTSRQHRYYRCSRSKKHLCDKKAVKKDWIENLVIQEVISLISDDGVLDDLEERIYQMQSQESNATLQLKDSSKKYRKNSTTWHRQLHRAYSRPRRNCLTIWKNKNRNLK